LANCRLQEGHCRSGGSLKTKTKEFLCFLQEVSYLLQEAYKKAKLISKEDPKAGNMSMRPTHIHVSIPLPFSIIFFISLCFFYENCVFYRKFCISTGSSVSCRTFGRTKFNFKRESDSGNLLVRPPSISVSIPRLAP